MEITDIGQETEQFIELLTARPYLHKAAAVLKHLIRGNP